MYAAIFIDAIVVKVRDGQVANRPFYAAIGVTVDGRQYMLGLWAGTPGDGEGAKYWLAVLTELKKRGIEDTMFVVFDGLKDDDPDCPVRTALAGGGGHDLGGHDRPDVCHSLAPRQFPADVA